MDPETKRAWRRLQKEIRENTPIVFRGLASSGKRALQKLYVNGAAVRRGRNLRCLHSQKVLSSARLREQVDASHLGV